MNRGPTTRRRTWLLLAAGGLLGQAGCAVWPGAGDQASAGFELPPGADALFAPARPVPAPGQVLAVDDAMRQYLRARLARDLGRHSPQRALLEALYTGGELRLDYDGQHTRTAAEAFADRRGNCLSLVLMTAAFAHELGLGVGFNEVDLPDPWQLVGDLLLRSGHVNLTLMRPTHQTHPGHDPDRAWTVDFLPGQDLKHLRLRRIGQPRVMAMFYNNRAAEALAQAPTAQAQTAPAPTAQAYWLLRAALQQDPGFEPAHNTMGVVFLRAGQLAWASAWFERILMRQPRHAGVLSNLALVRQAQGQPAEALALRQRRDGVLAGLAQSAPRPQGVAALKPAADARLVLQALP